MLNTPQLSLRRPLAADGPALAQALAEAMPDLVPWFRWAEVLDRFGDREDLEVRARVLEHRNAEGLERSWLLWQAERVVGEITLRMDTLRFGVLAFHVWMRPSAAGRGLATEAGHAALGAAAAAAEFVEAEVASTNFRSRRLLGRLGFEPYGRRRDHERYVVDCRPLAVVTSSLRG